MTEIHITADSDFWTGASTLALLSAKQADDAVVITAGNSDMVRRIEASGIKAVKCSVNGIFGSLNLSRVLRHIPGSAFEIYVHSPQARATVESALQLVGKQESITLISENPEPVFPHIDVRVGSKSDNPLLMWLGNITENCGLQELIEELGIKTEKMWRLKVVGHGKAKIVGPILKKAKALGIHDRIEWFGYSANPYEQMNGVTAGIVKNPQSVVAREFAAASIPTYTNLSDIL